MKKICLPVLLMLILITLFGCKVSDSPADDERRYACDAIPEGIYYFEDEPDVVYPYGNKFYEASYNTGNVGYREPENMEYHFYIMSAKRRRMIFTLTKVEYILSAGILFATLILTGT